MQGQTCGEPYIGLAALENKCVVSDLGQFIDFGVVDHFKAHSAVPGPAVSCSVTLALIQALTLLIRLEGIPSLRTKYYWTTKLCLYFFSSSKISSVLLIAASPRFWSPILEFRRRTLARFSISQLFSQGKSSKSHLRPDFPIVYSHCIAGIGFACASKHQQAHYCEMAQANASMSLRF